MQYIEHEGSQKGLYDSNKVWVCKSVLKIPVGMFNSQSKKLSSICGQMLLAVQEQRSVSN